MLDKREITMNEEINSNENNFFEIVNEDNSKNIAMQNYNELLEKFENLIKIIIAKINVGKQNAQNNMIIYMLFI